MKAHLRYLYPLRQVRFSIVSGVGGKIAVFSERVHEKNRLPSRCNCAKFTLFPGLAPKI
jgi:hypothetical protein